MSESTHSQLNLLFPRKSGFETVVSRLYEFKVKQIKALAARDPVSFFGITFKPGAARKIRRKDGDRLATIYNQVHQFSLLDPDVQVERLKAHLISVGSQRRSYYNLDPSI